MATPKWVDHFLSPWFSDQQLLDAVRNGSASAANSLVNRLTPKAHVLAWRMLGDKMLAQDIVQDAFIKLIQSDKFKGESSLDTYFHVIVSRLCLDRLRLRRYDTVDLDEDFHLLDVADEGARDPELQTHNEQSKMKVQAALMRLKPRQRMAITLWAYEEASAAEIARVLDLEVNAAHQILHRAKINLRHLLGDGHDN